MTKACVLELHTKQSLRAGWNQAGKRAGERFWSWLAGVRLTLKTRQLGG